MNSLSLRWSIPLMLAVPPAAAAAWSEQLQQADELHANGRHAQAAGQYQAILIESPADLTQHMAERITLRLAAAQLDGGDFRAARASLQPIIDAQRENAREALAMRHEVDHLQRESTQLLRRGLEQIRADPDSPWGYRDLVTGLKLQGRLNQAFAITSLALGVALDASHALALIEATKTIGAPAAAIDLAMLWLQTHPADIAARVTLLRLLVDHAPLDLTLRIHAESLPYLSEPGLQQLMLARRLANENQPLAALTRYRLLLNDPTLGLQSHLAAAALLQQTGDADQAMEMLRRAIERWPAAAPGDPRRRGVVHSPYTELVRLAIGRDQVESLEQHWPALTGPDGEQIRSNLSLAKSYLGLNQVGAQ